jgi:ABC-type enterochelin transport system permease subunit
MDFFERLFGFSPDGGSGTFELLLLAVPVLILAFVAAHRRSHARAGTRVAKR